MEFFWEAFVLLSIPIVCFHWLMTIMVMSPKLTIKTMDYTNKAIVAFFFYYLIFTPLLSEGLEWISEVLS